MRHPSDQAGFTLIELAIVILVVAVLAVVAIPSLLQSKIAANETTAISNLRALWAANEQYRNRFGNYPPTMIELETAGFIDSVLSTGSKLGYNFTYNTPAGQTYSIGAEPIELNRTGERGFFVDESGVIRFESTGAATSASAPVQ